ncbi:LVIVD repeat-containing protein [Fodinibius roseus]|uniref:LVIVD repeat-containing protein n=1 Tax=Fodinibius roseus TaxID=1194090 RepID=A0A1M5DVS7_9BACT|nr:Ig-like domain-containing protein [Fodinibius roseus]SHF70941.1 LVIVD repeat-containing protein [Fodinibius roseus]
MKLFQHSLLSAACACLLLFVVTSCYGQQSDSNYRIAVIPETLSLEVDETARLTGTVRDAGGNAVHDSVFFYSLSRESVSVSRSGLVKGLQPGTFELQAYALTPGNQRLTATIPVEVSFPPITDIAFTGRPGRMYADTRRPVTLSVTDAKGFDRNPGEVTLTSSDSSVAYVDNFGQLHAKKPGAVTITAQAGEATARRRTEVVVNPVTTIELTRKGEQQTRTGDVVRFTASPKNAEGRVIDDMPVEYSLAAQPDNNRGEASPAQVKEDGRFVARKPGTYTVLARAGTVFAEQTIGVEARDIQREVEVVGHALVGDVHTSDLWVWEGVDGNDYAVTGTWGGNGEAYFWDVTDPANMTIIDTVTVDARTVNDVKISEDGRVGVITREGASDRKNGIVILDVRNPHEVEIISEYSEGLTGGVHNAFIYEDHVYAVNNGRRYDIIDISDPGNPETVSRFELDTPGHAVHDVWVEDGIAYSSNWDDGVVAVDVGSTPAADSPETHEVGTGSPENPVQLGSYSYPSGWNHAAFPFRSQSTGDFYVIAGDEAFPNGLFVQDKPTIPAGWIHFIKFEGGWDHPKEVARYRVPEAGTHNFWVKGDTLYVAYYNAGLRVVDISGELMGNLYEQGREIARFVPTHHRGRIPNAAMSWGPHPYKGYIFVSDWNSGLWALKLTD